MFTHKMLKRFWKKLGSGATATPQRSKRRPTTKPWLEALEDRTMPSASPLDTQPIINTASPPAVPAIEAITAILTAMMDEQAQLVAAFEQDLSIFVYTEGQVISQEVAAFVQTWDSLLGINPPPPNPPSAPQTSSDSDSGVGRGSGSGSGSGSGAMTTALNISSNQPLNNSTQKTGSGSGSGSNLGQSTPVNSPAMSSTLRMKTMTAGSGSGIGSGSGSGSGSAEYVYFSSPSYEVHESDGVVDVYVDLKHASSQVVVVDVFTTNGSATNGTDYGAVSEFFSFQPGQTSVTVPITIDDDGTSDDSDGSENFNVELTAPSYAYLGDPSLATVTISDSPPPPPPPPGIGYVTGFVWQDNDDDGISQASEQALSGITVTLLAEDSGGNVLSTTSTKTAADGEYNFAAPTTSESGDLYQIQVSIPDNYTATLENASSTGINSNIDANGYSQVFALNVYPDVTVNAGLVNMLTAESGSYSVLPSGTTSFSADDGILAALPNASPNRLTAVLVSPTSYGSLTLNSDGSFSYTPGPNFTGNDSFTYEAYNGIGYSNSATVTLTTNPVDSLQTYSVTHDTPLSVDASVGLELGAYDADGDTLTTQLLSQPSNGTIIVNGYGAFTYTPNPGYVGTDSFLYTVSDGTHHAGPAIATINVVNDVPLAGDGDYGTTENQSLIVDAADGVLANAADDDGDSLTAQLVSEPSDGTLQLNGDGSFVYTPAPGFIGTDSFQYAASDGLSTSDPNTVTIYVGEAIPEIQSGSMPSAVAVADFNNDGNADVAMADQGLNTVSVYLGNGSGQISTTPIFTTALGSTPVALAAGVFTVGGNIDLAVANGGSNSVSILYGNGDGSFIPGTILTGFDDPVAVLAGNFGNGHEDLAVVNEGSDTVSILVSDGYGDFTLSTTLTTGSAPTSIAAGDFNSDGNLDLAVTNSGSNTVSVFLGNGNGTFQSGVTYAVGTTPMSVTTGDFDGDGNVDLAVANSGSSNVSILLGNGDGTFQAAANYAVGNDPVSVIAGNFAGPSYPGVDLAVVNEGSNDITVLSGISIAGVEDETPITTAPSPLQMALGDFGNNGQLQGVVVAMAAPGNGQVALVAALPDAAPKLRTAAYFQAKALKLVGIPEDKINIVSIDSLQEDYIVNQKITGQYAQLFSKKPNSFPAFGLAAYASSLVGSTIENYINLAKGASNFIGKNRIDPISAKLYYLGAELLIKGNQGFYTDIYWQCLAYVAGGLNQINAMNVGSPGDQSFADIDSGVAAQIWSGNLAFLYHEQHDLLQPQVFDLVPEFIGKILSTQAGPVFPGSDSFPKVVPDGNMANFNQRWIVWITGDIDPVTKKGPESGTVALWPAWQTYVAAWVLPNGDFKDGDNPLVTDMLAFIVGGLRPKT
jgi:hypothetical protein